MTAKNPLKKVKTTFGLEITPEDAIEYEFLKASGLLVGEGPDEVLGAGEVFPTPNAEEAPKK